MEKEKNDGRLPSGCMPLVLKDLKKSGINTDRDHLNYLLVKLIAKKKKDRIEKEENERRAIIYNELSDIVPVDFVHVDDGEMTLSDVTGTVTSLQNSASSEKNCGRPIGSSMVNKMKQETVRLKCVSEISTIYRKELRECRKKNSLTSKCYLTKLIKRKWEEYELDDVTIVSSETIRSRVKRGKLYASHPGTPPVLPEIVEKVIVDVVLMMGKIRNPLCVSQIIELANSIIMNSK